jgi:hypothetical protein
LGDTGAECGCDLGESGVFFAINEMGLNLRHAIAVVNTSFVIIDIFFGENGLGESIIGISG